MKQDANQPAIQPLTTVGQEQAVRLISIQASRSLCHRLAELGLTPGIEMAVVRDNGGPILLGIRHSRLALGRSLAQKIMVQPFKEV